MALLTKSPLGLAIALYVRFTDSAYPSCYLQFHLYLILPYFELDALVSPILTSLLTAY
jgi:hypothetical protein